MQRVSDNLLVADIQQAGDPERYRQYGIKHAIKLSYESPYDELNEGYPDGVEVHDYAMMDGPRNNQETMTEAVRTTANLIQSGDRVVVYCSAGASRSPSVAAVALAVAQDVNIQEAEKRVWEERNIRAHQDVWENAQRAVDEVRNSR